MNSRDSSSSESSASLSLIYSASALLGALALAAIVLVTSHSSIATIVIPLIIIGIAAVLLPLAASRLTAKRVIRFQIALAGLPGVGKTVYANVLCSVLLQGGSAGFRFTPETQTAQKVLSTLRGLRAGRWPAPTSVDNINQYIGDIAPLQRASVFSVILRGRTTFRLAIGDAAGEYWANPENKLDTDPDHPPLIESTFFSYVEKSDAIFYFIDCAMLTLPDSALDTAVDDLIGALSTMENLASNSRGRRAVALIFSKSDLLPYDLNQELLMLKDSSLHLRSRSQVRERPDEVFDLNSFAILRLVSALERMRIGFRMFVVSSTGGPAGPRISPENVQEPLDWALATFVGRRHPPISP